jgi:hypothetical protein
MINVKQNFLRKIIPQKIAILYFSLYKILHILKLSQLFLIKVQVEFPLSEILISMQDCFGSWVFSFSFGVFSYS